MKGITFGAYHSYNDLNLILSRKIIGTAAPKTNAVNVGGIDGVIDLTEALNGFPVYQNRQLQFVFTTTDRNNFLSVYSDIMNKLNGRKMQVILDDDPAFFYIARLTVEDFTSDKGIAEIIVNCDAEPYKYDALSSVDDWLWDSFDFETGIVNETANISVNGRITITIAGNKKPVCPTVTSSVAMKMIYGSNEYELKQGENKIYKLVITEGINSITFVGNGVISINYRGGSL